MTSALKDLAVNVVAGLLGAALMYLAVRVKQRVRKYTLSRAVRLFFGFPGKILIVHSTVLDCASPDPPSFSYPATDARAARTLTKLFESVGLREGVDFTVHPDRPDRDLPVETLWDSNVVLLCGPARNSIFAKIADALPMRYAMTLDADGRNALVDRRRHQRLVSSRELPAGPSVYDYGLVASLPNPNNLSRQLVILAGIHGTGTVGAVEFVADPRNLRQLIDRRVREIVSEVVRVDYDRHDGETPTRIELV